jgi:hypothetical protein
LHNKNSPPKLKRQFSFSFLLAIPGNFVIAGICLLSCLFLYESYLFEREIWALFATGLIGGLTLVGSSQIPRTRTLIHELKHAVVVLLTGNSLRSIHVEKYTGHVDYEMSAETVRFAPIIALAPYFFPILSLPMLILCLVFEESNKAMLTLGLGFCLATDLTTAFTELHPRQTDLKTIFGGALASASYLAGFHLMWFSVCTLWVIAGRKGYLYAGYLVWKISKKYLEGAMF